MYCWRRGFPSHRIVTNDKILILLLLYLPRQQGKFLGKVCWVQFSSLSTVVCPTVEADLYAFFRHYCLLCVGLLALSIRTLYSPLLQFLKGVVFS